MTCPTCATSPAGLCPEHARTSNHDDAVDTEVERLRERVAELEQQRARAHAVATAMVHGQDCDEKDDWCECGLGGLRDALSAKPDGGA